MKIFSRELYHIILKFPIVRDIDFHTDMRQEHIPAAVRKGKVCRLQFTVLVNDIGFLKLIRLYKWSRKIRIQLSYHAEKENQMLSPSNHFS